MTQNEQISTETHFLHLCSLADISLRISWAVRSNGSVTVDDVSYYVKQELAGQVINLVVHAPDKVFEVWHGATHAKQLPIKGLSGTMLSFEEYVSLMRQEARSEGHRAQLSYHGLHQASLWG